MIFSDIYTVNEVYSVLRQEHLYTSSSMPWLYTSLKDVKYQPALEDSARNKLNEIFVFNYMLGGGLCPAIKNEQKHLVVNHNGDQHLSYETVVDLSFNDLYLQGGNFKYLINQTNTSHLSDVYDKAAEALLTHHVNPKANKTCHHSSHFYGYLHDISGTPIAVKIGQSQQWSKSFNPTGNDLMDRLVAHCNRNPVYLKPEKIFHIDGKESIRLNCKYPEAFWKERKSSAKEGRSKVTAEINSQKIELTTEQICRKHLYGLSSAVGNFLTEEQGQYIYSVFPDVRQRVYTDGRDRKGFQNFRLDFEFVFENNELVDILLFRTTHYQFDEVETLIP